MKRRVGHPHGASFGAAIVLCSSTACVSVQPEVELAGETGDDGGAATIPADADAPAMPSPEAGGDAAGGGPVDAASTDCPAEQDGGAVILGCPCLQEGAMVCGSPSSGDFLCTAAHPVAGTVYEGLVWTSAALGPCGMGSLASNDAAAAVGAPDAASGSSSGTVGFPAAGDASTCMAPFGCGSGSSSGHSSGDGAGGPPDDADVCMGRDGCGETVSEDGDPGDGSGSVGDDALAGD